VLVLLLPPVLSLPLVEDFDSDEQAVPTSDAKARTA
jgi:hypothetical protein